MIYMSKPRPSMRTLAIYILYLELFLRPITRSDATYPGQTSHKIKTIFFKESTGNELRSLTV